jgi:hypothetical protein
MPSETLAEKRRPGQGEEAMLNCTPPLAETVIPRSDSAGSQRPGLSRAEEVAADAEHGFILAPRRILHAAIRIGKSFELVVECCVL